MRNAKNRQITAHLATLQNFDVVEKNGCRIRNKRPKINKV